MGLGVARPERGAERRAEKEQGARAGSLERGHGKRSQRADGLPAPNGNREGEIPHLRAQGPEEIEVGRAAGFAPQPHGRLEGEVEIGPEPGPLFFETYYAEGTVPPQLAGLMAAFGGMVVGSLALRSFQREATT